MGKGDDAVRRRRNKLQRKRMKKYSSNISGRVTAIIAAKKRRKSGKRRICEGMCFSLPTPEDPFNDRHDRRVFGRKICDKLSSRQVNGTKADKNQNDVEDPNVEQWDLKKLKVANLKDEQSMLLPAFSNKKRKMMEIAKESKVSKLGELRVAGDQCHPFGSVADCHSKFLILCLNAIEKAWLHDGTVDGDVNKPLMDNSWGAAFWEHCSGGSDILETTEAPSTKEQIAWLVSTASDVITRKEKEGPLVNSPFLLFLVPSQEKAIKVRALCKPLKALGIHTISIHQGASVDHQVLGLKICEPEFLVATPERLYELISLRAINISHVSLFVLDGLGSLINGGFLKTIKSIRQCVSGDPQTVIFSDFYGALSTEVVQNLLHQPLCRLSLSDSISSQSVGISQSIWVLNSEEEKIPKVINILNGAWNDPIQSLLPRVLFITGTSDRAQAFASLLRKEGFSISGDSSCGSQHRSLNPNHGSRKRISISVLSKEQIGGFTVIGEFEIATFIDFPFVDDYVEVLTTMARHTVNGALHSFLVEADIPSAGPLVNVLKQCCQPIPEILRHHMNSSLLSEH